MHSQLSFLYGSWFVCFLKLNVTRGVFALHTWVVYRGRKAASHVQIKYLHQMLLFEIPLSSSLIQVDSNNDQKNKTHPLVKRLYTRYHIPFELMTLRYHS